MRPYGDVKRVEIAIRALDRTRQILERCPRQGAERDVPEGARFLQISDTLARSLAGNIRIAEGVLLPVVS